MPADQKQIAGLKGIFINRKNVMSQLVLKTLQVASMSFFVSFSVSNLMFLSLGKLGYKGVHVQN